MSHELIDDHHEDRGSACILGASLDVGNRGVRALGISIIQLLVDSCPKIRPVLHYGNVKGGFRRVAVAAGVNVVEVNNCRLSLRSSPSQHILIILALAWLHRLGIRGPARRNSWLRSILVARFVGDIRGGDSFSDIYGIRRFLIGCLPLLSVVLLKKPYTMLPQTYGPFRSIVSRAVAAALLRRAETIVTRDRRCESVVLRLTGRPAQFCPDVAFTLEPRAPKSIHGMVAERRTNDCVVGVNVSGLLFTGGYTGRNMFGLQSNYRVVIETVIGEILRNTQAKVLLVPHVFGSENEEEACSLIRRTADAHYPDRVSILVDPLDESELKWIIGQTDFFVGSRMHACIAALSQCVPAVGLAYSDKFLGVFESAGLGATVIDLRKVETSAVVDRTVRALKTRTELREQLLRTVPEIKDQIRRKFSQLMQ